MKVFGVEERFWAKNIPVKRNKIHESNPITVTTYRLKIVSIEETDWTRRGSKYIKGRGNYWIINPKYNEVGRHSRTKISNLYHQSKAREEI